jgi:hypothetical protein
MYKLFLRLVWCAYTIPFTAEARRGGGFAEMDSEILNYPRNPSFS